MFVAVIDPTVISGVPVKPVAVEPEIDAAVKGDEPEIPTAVKVLIKVALAPNAPEMLVAIWAELERVPATELESIPLGNIAVTFPDVTVPIEVMFVWAAVAKVPTIELPVIVPLELIFPEDVIWVVLTLSSVSI